MATDPVCGMSVDERSCELTLFRDGRTRYFCSAGCLAEFADPQRARQRLARRLAVAWPLSLAIVALVYVVSIPGGPYLELAGAAVVQVYAGEPFYRGLWDALRSRVANMDVLIAIGSSLAFGYSALAVLAPGRVPAVTFFDASSLIVTLILTGHYLEQATRRRASGALQRLSEMLPRSVRVRRDGRALEIAPSAVQIGDLVEIAPGGRFPADGKVVTGRSDVDESILTGESRPIRKGPGDRVIAGALNQDGLLEVVADRVGDDTFLGTVGRLLIEAETSRMPVRQLADRISERFVPLVLGLGLVATAAWALGGVGPAVALLVLVSVIITACPCAFGIATPAAILVGTGRAAELGILFRGAESIDTAARVNLLLTDKTGTITTGRPVVREVVPAPGHSEREVLEIAGGLEASVRHPLALAVVAACQERSIPALPVDGISVRPGEGVRGTIDGAIVSIGPLLGGTAPNDLGALVGEAERLDRLGRSGSIVRRGDAVVGLLGFSDALAPGVPATVERLRRQGIEVIMVTGDSEAAARAAAEEAGIREFHARVSPSGKVDLLRAKRAAGHCVAYVGDGVNDAPVLAAADLGIALGSGTEVAQEAGNVLLVRSEFALVPTALSVGRRTVAKVRQNLGWAIGYNAVLLPIAAGALVPLAGLGVFFYLPITGALAMGLSSTIVVANSLSLRRTAAEEATRPAGRSLAIPSSVGPS
ncbi:MAG TPA: heavy metal translocating P-type ATPase [Thermoplasmata archaeon]|nr:heavy metal translocating P-type ATPase [Thermoplasmata archaeon]